MNEKTEILIFNILFYSKLYIENKDDNLRNYLFNIYENSRKILIIKITYEIENNINFKQNNSEIYNNSIFPIFKLLIRKIIQNNDNNKFKFNIIDDLLYNSLIKITNINSLNYNNFLSINISEFESLHNYMKEILKQFNEKYNMNKSLGKFNIIKKINDSMNKKKIFTNILLERYINKGNEEDILKMNKMFKYLNTVFMIFIQFLLEKEKLNEENLNLYIIFIYIIIDLGFKTE